MTDWYIMATRQPDGRFVLGVESCTFNDFGTEYNSLANRVGGANIRVFKEVHVRPVVNYVLTDEESFMKEPKDKEAI